MRWIRPAGFVGICVIVVAIVAMLLRMDFFIDDIGGVLNLSIDVLGTLVCALLYYGCNSDRKRLDVTSILLSSLLFVTSLTLLMDAVFWFLDGNPQLQVSRTFVPTLFYVGVNLVMYLFWRYACDILRPKAIRSRRMDVLRRVVMAAAIIISLANLFVPVLFRINTEGEFEKTQGYLLGYIYIFLTFILIIYEAFRSPIRKLQKGCVVAFASVPILTFLSTAQLWLAVSYSVAIISMLMSACILFPERVHLKELVIRLFTLLLLSGMLVFGPSIYAFSYRKAMNDGFENANRAMLLLSELLDDTGLEQLKDPANSELYQDTRNSMRTLCQAFDLQHLYVEMIDPDLPYRYFIIAVGASDRDDAVTREILGWPGATIWSENSKLTEQELSAYKGEYPHEHTEQNNRFGHNLDWVAPYKDANGTVLAILGADIEMSFQQAVTTTNALRQIAPVLVLYFITLLVLLHMLNRAFLSPIRIIAAHIREYVMEGKRKKERLVIKGGYEVWSLAKSFDFMTNELDEYEEIRANDIKEKQRIATELDMASDIQQHYLPGTFPAFPDRNEFDIFASMIPAKEVGGDFYDFFLIDSDHLAMVVADVSGKGVPAALFMMASKIMLKNAAKLGFSPAGVLETVNEQLAENNKERMFVTVWLGILEISSGVLTFADAGHEEMILYSGGKWYYVAKETGRPLAIIGSFKPADPAHPVIFKDQSVQLRPGDAIFQYTDGVTETNDPRENFFGEQHLIEAIGAAPSDSGPQAVIDSIRGQLKDFQADAEQFDDITMLCLFYHG